MEQKLMSYALLVLALFGGWACNESAPSDSGKGRSEAPTEQEEAWLEVRQPHFSLREEPAYEARPIRALQPGERVRSLGEQSPYSTRLEMGGSTYHEPWLLAELDDGARGWIHAAAFQEGLPEAVRLSALFGAGLAEQAILYQEAFEQAHSQETAAQAMAMGIALQEALAPVLALRAAENERPENLFWLGEALPGLQPHLLEDGRTFYLFMDYRPYLPLAQASEGPADDAFLELCLMAFPEDSIEYFHPAWVIQAGEDEVHSLLGRGLHFRFLEALDRLQQYEGLFGEQIGRYRKQLLNDMAGAGVSYWESREKAVAELDSILRAGFDILGEDGQAALQERRRQFENPEKHAIQFNHRSGIYGRRELNAPYLKQKDQ